MLKYKYPKLKDWLNFERLPDGDYIVTNDLEEGEDRLLTAEVMDFAMHLDGHTDPYSILTDVPYCVVDIILRMLDDYDLLRYSRVLTHTFMSVYITLFTLRDNDRGSRLCSFMNDLLLMAFLPVFSIGYWMFFNGSSNLDFSFGIPSICIGIMLGMSVHEMAHAVACYAYGGKVHEIGVILSLTSGVYVMVNRKLISGHLKNAQITGAGVEANLLTAGAALMLGAFLTEISGSLLNIAVINTLLAAGNLLLANGLDGSGILCDLGIPLWDTVRKDLESLKVKFSKAKRANDKVPDPVHLSFGFSAYMIIVPAYIALIAINIWKVIQWL